MTINVELPVEFQIYGKCLDGDEEHFVRLEDKREVVRFIAFEANA